MLGGGVGWCFVWCFVCVRVCGWLGCCVCGGCVLLVVCVCWPASLSVIKQTAKHGLSILMLACYWFFMDRSLAEVSLLLFVVAFLTGDLLVTVFHLTSN